MEVAKTNYISYHAISHVLSTLSTMKQNQRNENLFSSLLQTAVTLPSLVWINNIRSFFQSSSQIDSRPNNIH